MRKLLTILLSVAFIICWCSVLPVSATEEPRYGYSLLTNDVQRTAYQEFLTGVESLKAEIIFSTSATKNTVEAVSQDVTQAILMVIKDWPEFFWFHGKYQLSANGTEDNVIISAKPDYIIDDQAVNAGSPQLATAKRQLQQAVIEALSTVSHQMSDYEIALGLHNYLIQRVTYLKVGEHQTAYGALVSGNAVCAGYARAYQLLLLEAGIPCTYIKGSSIDPNTGKTEDHAWNLLWLDGKCYYTDVTWDDQGSNGVFHEYFNMSKEEISKTHVPENGEILPNSCGHENYRYFVKTSGRGICDIPGQMESKDVAQYFQLKSLEGREAVYFCAIHYHNDNFDQWFQASLESLAQTLDFALVDCEIVRVGQEHHVILKGTLADQTPTPTVTPTESAPTNPQESTQPTQQTQPSTEATEATIQTSPTQESTESTSPAEDATVPTEPTSSTEQTQSSDNIEETQSSLLPEPDTSAATEQILTPDEDDSTDMDIIFVIGAFVAAGCVTGVVVYFINKRRS